MTTATVTEMREALDQREVSAGGLLAQAKRVIAERDGAVKAFVEVFASAEEDCEAGGYDALQEGRGDVVDGYPYCNQR